MEPKPKQWSLEAKIGLVAVLVALAMGLLGAVASLYPVETRSWWEKRLLAFVFLPVPLWLVVTAVAGAVLLMGLRRKVASPAVPAGAPTTREPRPVADEAPLKISLAEVGKKKKPPVEVDDDELFILRRLASGRIDSPTLHARSKWGTEKFKLVMTRLARKSLIVIHRVDWSSSDPETFELSHEGREFMSSRGELK
jgi:hypothetical protein